MLWGQRAAKETSPGLQIETLNSLIDHQNVFIRQKTFDGVIESICDSGANVSCLSGENYESLILKDSLKLEVALSQLKAASKWPIETPPRKFRRKEM